MPRRFLLLPPQILWSLLALAAVIHWGLGWSFRIARLPGLGWLLIALGVLINGWASQLFDASGTPVRPDASPSTIVERGPFRWSRNPMYAGLITLLVGTALVAGSLPFWLLPIIYAAILRFVFIPHEERVLLARFGGDYEDYVRRVDRWLGRHAGGPP